MIIILLHQLIIIQEKIKIKYYIIQFVYQKIIINNLLEDELYSELSNKPET